MASKGECDVDLAPSTATSDWRDNGLEKVSCVARHGDREAQTPSYPAEWAYDGPRGGMSRIHSLEDEPWDDVCC